MCGVFGFNNYGENKIDLESLAKNLGIGAASRGLHSTGISYNYNGKLHIRKKPVSAYVFNFKLPGRVTSLMGHTRHATQGPAKDNYNNHPFRGKVQEGQFAFAHNGIIYNDYSLQKSLPHTKIKTDSYVGVQLIEQQKTLDFDSLVYMSEQVSGNFTFTLLDDRDNMYFVKGSNPIYILDFRELGIIVYASTKEIVHNAVLKDPILYSELWKSATGNKTLVLEEVLSEGEILKVYADGNFDYAEFTPQEDYYGYDWRDYTREYDGGNNTYYSTSKNYNGNTLALAKDHGFTFAQVQKMAEWYTMSQIGNFIYSGEFEVEYEYIIRYEEKINKEEEAKQVKEEELSKKIEKSLKEEYIVSEDGAVVNKLLEKGNS